MAEEADRLTAERGRGVSAAVLKHTAFALMVLNHLGLDLCTKALHYTGQLYWATWYLSRGAFVIFAFQIAEGMRRTHDRRRYILRLALMALISEIPFDLFQRDMLMYSGSQNVFFTLTLGAFGIYLIDLLTERPLLQLGTALLTGVFAALLHTDYGSLGVMLIFAFYFLRQKRKLMLVTAALVLFFGEFISCLRYLDFGLDYYLTTALRCALMELHGALVFPLLVLYNGEKGKMLPKAFYYAFYPLHLLLLRLCFG